MFSGEGFQTIGAICGVGALLWRLFDQVKPRGLQRRLHAVFMKEALRRVEERFAASRATDPKVS